MNSKMKLLIGLLILGIVLLGTGLVFLLLPTQQTVLKVTLTPAPGTYLFNSQNDSSYVILKNVQIEKVVADRQYVSPWSTKNIINAGEPILIVSGTVQNNHPTNKEIMMYAEGVIKQENRFPGHLMPLA